MNHSMRWMPCLLLGLCLTLGACKGDGEDESDPARFRISTGSLPQAALGLPYSAPISADNGSGAGFSWGIVAGNLPPGLTIAATGTPATVVSGTPNTIGSYTFTVQVVDSDNSVATRQFSITVGPVLGISTSSLPAAELGVSYSTAVVATGGSGAGYVWILLSGTLPAGLALSVGGTISGTPGALGSANLVVQVQDSMGSVASKPLTLDVYPPLNISTTTAAGVMAGRPASIPLAATGGSGSGYSWQIVAGALPPGLALAPSGTPGTTLGGIATQSGTFNFTVRVTDSVGLDDEQALSLAVHPPLRITSTWLPDGTQGGTYAAFLTAQGGLGPYAFSLTRGSFPAGLSIGAGPSLAGTPSAQGTFSFRLRATDAAGFYTELEYELQIVPSASPLALREQTCPDGVSGRPYAFSFNATGGSGAGYQWSVISGALPPGLLLTASGTPWTRMSGSASATGVFNFTLGVSDSASNTATRPYTLTVRAVGEISTSAGSGGGSSGGIGNGGPATDSILADPRGIAVDAAGNIYVADANHSRVRRISASTGIITTFAGTGNDGYSGDGGQASAAELWLPHDVCLHEVSNSLYIADYGNRVVRRVDLGTGVISTYAGGGSAGLGDGGAATAAEMDYPEGLGVDSSGNLYIACSFNLYGSRVRRVDFTTKIITTVAGTGVQGYSGDTGLGINADLSVPRDVACDSGGHIFIADAGNYRIRRVDRITGIITTFAGTGVYGFSGDGGPALAAQMRNVNAVYFDSLGNLLLSDELNHRIRRIDTSGNINTIAGSGPTGSGTGSYGGDGGSATSANLNRQNGVALSPTGDLIIADRDNQRIRRVAGGTQIITTIAGGGSGLGGGQPPVTLLLANAGATCFDAAGNFFFSDYSNTRVYRVKAATGLAEVYAGTGVAGFSGDSGLAGAAQLNGVGGLAVDALGNLFIADTENHRVRRVDVVTRQITTIAGNGTQGFSGDGGAAGSAQLAFPIGMAIHPTGRLLIADESNFRIRSVDLSTGIITTIAGTGFGFSGDGGLASSAQFGLVRGVAVDLGGNIYVADRGNRRVRRIDALTGVIQTIAGDGTVATADVSDIAVLPNGDLVIADNQNHRIKFLASGTATLVDVAGSGAQGNGGDGGPATAAELYYPGSLSFGPSGDVYISSADRVRTVRRP